MRERIEMQSGAGMHACRVDSPIMSFEVELEDVGGAVVRREVVVIDFSLPPPARLVNAVSLLQGIAAEVCRLPVTDE
jgi:hypothetical protein